MGFKPTKAEAVLICRVAYWIFYKNEQPPAPICHYLADCLKKIAGRQKPNVAFNLPAERAKGQKTYVKQSPSANRGKIDELMRNIEITFRFIEFDTDPVKLKNIVWNIIELEILGKKSTADRRDSEGFYKGVYSRIKDKKNVCNRLHRLAEKDEAERAIELERSVDKFKGLVSHIVFQEISGKYPAFGSDDSKWVCGIYNSVTENIEVESRLRSLAKKGATDIDTVYLEYILAILSPHYIDRSIPDWWAFHFYSDFDKKEFLELSDDAIYEFCSIMSDDGCIYHWNKLWDHLPLFCFFLLAILAEIYDLMSAKGLFPSLRYQSKQPQPDFVDRDRRIVFFVRSRRGQYQYVSRSADVPTITSDAGKKFGLSAVSIDGIFRKNPNLFENFFAGPKTLDYYDAWFFALDLNLIAKNYNLEGTPEREVEELRELFFLDGELLPAEKAMFNCALQLREKEYFLETTSNEIARHNVPLIYKAYGLISRRMEQLKSLKSLARKDIEKWHKEDAQIMKSFSLVDFLK